MMHTATRDTAVSAELGRARSHVATLERRERALHGGAEVVVLCWPAEEEQVDRLESAGLPRLVLVEIDEFVPTVHELQRMIRVPITDINEAHREHSNFEPARRAVR